MTGKTTPLYIVCSPSRCVGKTLIARLLTEFYIIKDRPVAAFDLADEGPQLADYLPRFATIANINDIRGQMALFDRLIADKGTPTVIDVSHRAFKNFFTIAQEITFFGEACLRSITPIILFILDPSAVSIEAYAKLKRQFMNGSLLPVRNQIKAGACTVTPNASMPLSSLDVPLLGFSLRVLIDRQSFSFSQFWQPFPAGAHRAVDEPLRGWLEYIFSQFRHLEFSLGYEEPSAPLTIQSSRQPHTTYRQQSDQLLHHPPKQNRRVDDPIDQSGNVIIGMLQKAAELSNGNCVRSQAIANELSCQLQATEGRIHELESEIEHFRDRACRAETWLQMLKRAIEQRLIDPMGVTPKSP
jgi:hypothetical protein